MAFSITGAIAGLNYGWLTAIDRFIDNPFIFGVIIILLGLVFIKERKARIRFFAALLLTFFVATTLKTTLGVQMPCAIAGVDTCPTDYSLPSTHSAVAFTLMFALLDKKSFPIFLIFALFVAFSRINFGVHTFEDVCAGLPLAFISVFLVERVCERWKLCLGN